jgi:hypothetical protein
MGKIVSHDSKARDVNGTRLCFLPYSMFKNRHENIWHPIFCFPNLLPPYDILTPDLVSSQTASRKGRK